MINQNLQRQTEPSACEIFEHTMPMRAPAGAGKALNLKGAALAQYERSPPQQPSGPPPTARLFRPLGNCSPGGLYTARSTCGIDFASGALNRPRRRRARVVAGT